MGNKEDKNIIGEKEAAEIRKIYKDMQKDQFYLQGQYAIGIVEAKAKIIDEQLSMKYQREVMKSITGRIKSRKAYMPSL